MDLVEHLLSSRTPLELAKELAQQAKENAALRDKVGALEVEIFWLKVADRKIMENQVIEMAGSGAVAQGQQRAVMTTAATPAEIVRYAMQHGATPAEIREFMALQREWEADEARKAYVAAMAEFKMNPPEVVKDKLVGYKNKDGTVTGYTHATLGNVTEAIVAGLAKHGFSHRWVVDQTNGQITVTCVLTHKLGHAESTVMSGRPDDSGKKNGIQQVASTVTYLSRYTLLAATGIATKDQSDDDGAAFGSTDTKLADSWIAKVNAATTDDDVLKVWNDGAGILEAKDTHGYDEFKNAVAARRGAIKKGGAK